MGKDPAFLFYSSDFLLGTLVMPFEDKGKYITLLSYMHQNGRISEDTAKLLVGAVSDNLKLKFKIDENGLWYNERLEEEILKRRSYGNSSRTNGQLGGRPPLDKVNENISEKYPFEKFWKMYDKPTEKQSCILKWNKLTESDKELIFQRLPLYVAATPERQFRKNPLTYINRKIWLDDFIPEALKKPKKSAFKQMAETGSYA
jgi:hypothetical protein